MRPLTILLLLIASTPIFAQSSNDAAIFQRSLSVLRQKTQVPPRLPTYLAAESETFPLQAIVEAAARTHYKLEIAFTPDCQGRNVCHYGMVSGQAVGRNTKRLRGKRIRLAQGITGYFVDAICDRTCNDSTLSWQQGGYRYTVGIKAADVETFTKVANSAIEKPSH